MSLVERHASVGPTSGSDPMSRAESSRRRYRTFVQAYRIRTLEDPADAEHKPLTDTDDAAGPAEASTCATT